MATRLPVDHGECFDGAVKMSDFNNFHRLLINRLARPETGCCLDCFYNVGRVSLPLGDNFRTNKSLNSVNVISKLHSECGKQN